MRVFAMTAAFAALCCFCLTQSIQAQTPAFTYQGKLTDSSVTANGQYDFTFKLFTAVSGGTQIGMDVLSDDVQVTAGIFTVNLDFGAATFIAGADRYLEIAVRPGASTGTFTPLAPRQPITSSPYSIKTQNATSADSLSASCVLCVTDAHIVSIDGPKISGTVANAVVPAGNISGVLGTSQGGTGIGPANPPADTYLRSNGFGWTASGLSGNGSGLTNLNGANITNNTINAAALAPEVVQSKLSLLGSLRWDLLRSQSDFATGTNPRGVAFDGSNIWIANSGSSNVTKLRASDGVNLGTFLAGSVPIKIAFDGASIWVANLGGNTVTKLRASDGVNLGTFAVGSAPGPIAFDGANIWVVNLGSNNVQKLRATDGVSLGTFPVAANSEGIAFDGANMWVVSRTTGNVMKLRASDGASLGTFTVGGTAIGVAFDGANMWFAINNPSGIVTKLRASDGANLGTFPVGANPREIAFDGANIWVANGGSNNMTKLRASDGVNLGTFPVGTNPGEIAFDGANIWVSNNGSNNVTRLLPAFP